MSFAEHPAMDYGSGLKSMRIQLIVQEEKRAALLQE
jgi:hypothetical protein